MTQKLILPSLLSAPFFCLGKAINELEENGIDVLHFDVMDGHFVPNITVGPLIIRSLSPHVRSRFDVHLMVTNPAEQIEWFLLPKVRSVTVHIEACQDPRRDLARIRQENKGAGISLKPATPVEAVDPVLESIDQILVMTVDPGFGGQKLMPETLKKVEHFARKREQLGLDYIIQVDGGINEETIRSACAAGADEFVAGSAVFSEPNPVEAYKHLTDLIRS